MTFRYNQDIIENENVNQDSIEDSPKIIDNLEDNLESIPEKMINPNMDKKVFEIPRVGEVRNKPKSKIPKNQPISNVIGNTNDSMVTRRQSRLNGIGFVCYTSQLMLKNVEEVLRNESWTTALQEELN